MNLRLLPFFLLLVVLLMPAWSAGMGPLPEVLHYRVTYQGLFSAGAKVPIADVTLRTRLPQGGAPYVESEVTASSERFSTVEAIHPIRYHLRSWFWPDRSGVLAAEYHEFGRPDDIEHKLIYLDDPQRPFVTRNLLRDGEQALRELSRGHYRARVAPGQRHAFDRLGLLQAVRARDLSPGNAFAARVSNGSTLFRYYVKVEKQVPLSVGGQDWSALKVRFDGMEVDDKGRERHAHRPIYLWLSADARHLPLLAEARAAVGRFRVELREVPVTRLAAASPPAGTAVGGESAAE